MVFVSDLFNPSTVLAILITLSLRYEWKEFFSSKEMENWDKSHDNFKNTQAEKRIRTMHPFATMCNTLQFNFLLIV